jgi:hypothetical protein
VARPLQWVRSFNHRNKETIMKTKTASFALTAAALFAALAHAEGSAGVVVDRVDAPRAAPERALELTLGQGYSQGFGRGAFKREGLGDLGRQGYGVQLGLGYRIDPRFMVGFYAEGARFADGGSLQKSATSYSAGFGIQADYHLLPYSQIDPWVGIGTGLRGYVVDRDDPGTEVLLGYDIARLRVGADYKLTPSVAIGPMVGATLTRFGGYGSSESSGLQDIENRGYSTFLFVGIQGRFDLGGETFCERETTVASR